MPQMHAVTAGPATSIQEERLAFFITAENPVEVAMTENETSSQEWMWPVSCQSFESLQ